MKNTIERKCNACKDVIKIKRNNIQGVVYYKNLYYHTDCFCELAEKRSKAKRGNTAEWKEALDNIAELERHAKEVLTSRLMYSGAKDDLNEYLIDKYNIQTVPNRFWQVVADLNNGIYKHKRCKKVSTEILLEAWKWGQRKLDEINKYNKAHHKGPKDDNERIPYDLAILVNKIPNYLAYKAKQDVLSAEVKTPIIHIDYDSMIRTEVKQEEGLGDISELLDEF